MGSSLTMLQVREGGGNNIEKEEESREESRSKVVSSVTVLDRRAVLLLSPNKEGGNRLDWRVRGACERSGCGPCVSWLDKRDNQKEDSNDFGLGIPPGPIISDTDLECGKSLLQLLENMVDRLDGMFLFLMRY